MCSDNLYPAMNRRDFLRLSGTGLAGAVLLGTAGGRVLAQAGSTLKPEFEAAAGEYEVPVELLMAMGYVNTLWEMPPPDPFKEGDIHALGAYGIMQLMQNPWSDTLSRAASLTGLPEEQLKTNRAANIRGGAAVLAEIQGEQRPDELNAWQEAVAEYAELDLYAVEVYETLQEGASLTISTGETLDLAPQEGAEAPAIFTAQGRNTDYSRATWKPAARHNKTNADRERSHNINKIVIHIVDGTFGSAINTFQNESSNVSAHYVISRRGKIVQMVRHEDIAWHAGNWDYNKHSIGIEHAGTDENPNAWSRRMFRASARLSAYIARRHNVPVDRSNIVLHRNVPGVSKPCPGYYFEYDRYLKLVKRMK